MSTTADPKDELEPERALDVEIALEAMGFQWVRWDELSAGAKAMEDRHGRFLAPADRITAQHEEEAGSSTPLAPGWDRFVPFYSTRIEDAMPAAEKVGLFRRSVTVRHDYGDGWIVRTDRAGGTKVHGRGNTLAEALCRAVLEVISLSEDPDRR